MAETTKAFKFRGKHYDNLMDFMRKHNLEREEFVQRIRSGESLASIADTMGSKVASKVEGEEYGKIRLGNTSYANLKTACLQIGAEEEKVAEFMKTGISAENALIAYVETEEVVISGKTYNSLRDIARRYDIGEKKLLNTRLKSRSYSEALMTLGKMSFFEHHKEGAKEVVARTKAHLGNSDSDLNHSVNKTKELIKGTGIGTYQEGNMDKQVEQPKQPQLAQPATAGISTDIFSRD